MSEPTLAERRAAREVSSDPDYLKKLRVRQAEAIEQALKELRERHSTKNPRYRGEGYRYVRTRWGGAKPAVTDLFEGRGGRVVRVRTVKGTREQQDAAVHAWLTKNPQRVDVNKRGGAVAKKKAAKRKPVKKAARKKVTRKAVKSKHRVARNTAKKAAARKQCKRCDGTGGLCQSCGKPAETRCRCAGSKFGHVFECPDCRGIGKLNQFGEALENPKRKHAKKVARKRNSSSVSRAKSLVKKFIGRATGKVTTAHHPSLPKGTTLAQLTRLDYLKLRNPNIKGGLIAWKKNERPALASTPSGRKYFFVGGNQDLNIVPPVKSKSVVRNPTGMVDLGEVLQLGYTATKHVNGFKKSGYYHKLGEENGKRPRLFYDRKHKQMHFVGGDYRTEAEGIAN